MCYYKSIVHNLQEVEKPSAGNVAVEESQEKVEGCEQGETAELVESLVSQGSLHIVVQTLSMSC